MKMDFKLKSKKYSKSIIPIFYFTLIILSKILIISTSNEIIIKISGTGEQSLLSENFYPCPSSIYLNNQPVDINSTNCKKINIPEGVLSNTIK